MAIDKVLASPDEAVSDVPDGATVAVAGFGVGHRFPLSIIRALRAQGAKELCVVTNFLGGPGAQAQILAENNQVAKLIVSFASRPRMSTASVDQILSGAITFEMISQGTLVERLRAGGSGIAAFYTATGADTALAQGKEIRYFDGRPHVLEHALKVDYAFIRAHRADRMGNLQFRGGSRNFNPSFAKAARIAVVEVDEIVEVGELAPDDIHLPGIFVDRVVQSTVKLDHRKLVNQAKREADSRRDYNGKPALSRREIAAVAASLLPDRSYVNLGTGIPSLVSDYVVDRDVVLHAENGVLGFGGVISADEADPDVFNAGGNFVALKPGAAFFDSVESFEIARSGRLSAVVLGAFQVDATGSFANWVTPALIGGGIGGAMDLAASPSKLIITMEHMGSGSQPKLVEKCTYELTARERVDVVVTDLALLERIDGRFVLSAVCAGFTPEEVVALTEMDFLVPDQVGVMQDSLAAAEPV